MYLSWKNLVCGYRGREPLNLPFSGEVAKPGIYAILGPNGSGKSTLMRTWLGLIPPIQGECTILPGEESLQKTPILGYVPQHHSVNPWFQISVRNLIAQGFGGPGRTRSEARLSSLLAEWELQRDADRSFHELSMGQKTRALVARALASHPRIIFLDEPLASLDIHCQNFLMNSLATLVRESQVCVFMIDHHLENYKEKLAGIFSFEREHYRNTCSISYEETSAFGQIRVGKEQQCPQ